LLILGAKAREARRTVPVLAMSGAHQPIAERCVLDLGFDARLA